MDNEYSIEIIKALQNICTELKTTNLRLSQIEDKLDRIHGGMP